MRTIHVENRSYIQSKQESEAQHANITNQILSVKTYK